MTGEGVVLWCTSAPKVCKIIAFMAIIMGLGLLFYILLGFRYVFLRVPRTQITGFQGPNTINCMVFGP